MSFLNYQPIFALTLLLRDLFVGFGTGELSDGRVGVLCRC